MNNTDINVSVSAYFANKLLKTELINEIISHKYYPNSDTCVVTVGSIAAKTNLEVLARNLKDSSRVRQVTILTGDINGEHIFKMSGGCLRAFKNSVSAPSYSLAIVILLILAAAAFLVYNNARS